LLSGIDIFELKDFEQNLITALPTLQLDIKIFQSLSKREWVPAI